MNLFLIGTDTNVGKTYVASLLIRALRAAGRDCVGMKPRCWGERTDAEELHAACAGAVTLNEINPVWLRPLAAMIENRNIDLGLIRETFVRLRGAHELLIVEGAWLERFRECAVEGGERDADVRGPVFRQLREVVQVAGDEVVFRDDADRVAKFREHGEAAPRELEPAFDGLEPVADRAHGDGLRLPLFTSPTLPAPRRA